MIRVFMAALAWLSIAPLALAGPALEPLSIVTASGTHAFEVEVMRTPAERERGLMFRKSMAADHGMLFDFKTAAPVLMWMKNTFIALDMVFIGKDGRVISTTQDAVPMSETVISSHGDALAVLEVVAGTVKRLDVKPGDKVENAMFAK